MDNEVGLWITELRSKSSPTSADRVCQLVRVFEWAIDVLVGCFMRAIDRVEVSKFCTLEQIVGFEPQRLLLFFEVWATL